MYDSSEVSIVLDRIIKDSIANIWIFFRELIIHNWMYALIFFVLFATIIITQILMQKKNNRNKLSSGVNSAVGGLVYTIFSLIIFGISYLIFGTKVVDEIWFIMIGTLSFLLTGFFLRSVGFWRYKKIIK